MKVIIVSGFLGSGKTTFIEKLSQKLNNVVILENDYAKANVDSRILKSNNLDVFSLENGCICCDKKNDFATNILTISNTLNPDYLIIEPTGLGYLSKVIKNIKSIEYERIKLLSPIAIVDYINYSKSLNDYEDLFIDQIKNSNKILISKTESIKEDEIEILKNKLEKYTNADIIKNHYHNFKENNWDNLLGPFIDYNILDTAKKHIHLDNIEFKNVKFKDFNQLGTVFNAICSDRFGKLLRSKGFAEVSDKKVKIDIVQGNFKIEKCLDSSIDNSIIFIGENLDKKAFKILFNN